MASLSAAGLSILADIDIQIDKPLYEGKVRPNLMSKVNPRNDNAPVVTKEIEIGDETENVDVRPIIEHWGLYFIDGLSSCSAPGGTEAYNRFLEKHVVAFGDRHDANEMGVTKLRKLSLAVFRATVEYHSDSESVSPHYIY